MYASDAPGLAHELRRLVRAGTARASDSERLERYVVRHLPLQGAAEGSNFIPPMYFLKVAEALELPRVVAMAAAATGALFFAAADLADDCADGDVRHSIGLDVNDLCRLLFIQQRALAELAIDVEIRVALCALFATCGAEMTEGQQDDLLGTNAMTAAPSAAIARRKSGGELAVFFGAPALLGGHDPAPWLAFGRALGTLVQILSDYLDLFLKEDGDDWRGGKPTLPLQTALAHPELRAAALLALAGRRDEPERCRFGLWVLARAGAGDALAVTAVELKREMIEARDQITTSLVGSPGVATAVTAALDGICSEAVEYAEAVVAALVEYAGDAGPVYPSAASRVPSAKARAIAFLSRQAPLEVAPWEAALICGVVDDKAWRKQALSASAADLDWAGLVLQAGLGPRLGRRAQRRMDEALRGVDSSGSLGGCLATDANAALGLYRLNPARNKPEAERRLSALARAALKPAASRGCRYTPVGLDFMVLRALCADGLSFEGQHEAVDHISTRMAARRQLDSSFGTPLETALCGASLAQISSGVEAPAAVLMVILEAQDPDGGWPADPLRRGGPASRAVATALALSAIDALLRAKTP